MRVKIFMAAFCVAFGLFFCAGAVWVYGWSAKTPPKTEEKTDSGAVPAESESLVLVFEQDGNSRVLSILRLDAQNGRIPVLSFSPDVVFEHGGGKTAGELYSELGAEGFCAAVSTELGIETDGWFVWDKSTCEKVMAKAGAFDYILEKPLYYADGERYINLAAGVQSISGKKLFDILTYPNFDEITRCHTASRLIAAFFGRRLRRFLSEGSAPRAAVYNSTKNSADAFFRARLHASVLALCGENAAVASHITCDMDEDEHGRLFFSDETRTRIKKYFS